MITMTPADVQDRDAARDVFWRLRLTQPQIAQVWADRGYAGDLVDWARDRLWLTLRIVSRPKGTKGFVVLPSRHHSRAEADDRSVASWIRAVEHDLNRTVWPGTTRRTIARRRSPRTAPPR